MGGFKVLLPQEVAAEGKDFLREHGYQIITGSGITVDILKKEIAGCDAALIRTAPVTAAVLEAGRHLKVIAKHGIGVDNIDVQKAEELGIYVLITPLANANTVAEHTLGLILACAKNLVRHDRSLRDGDFEIRGRILGIDLEGKTLGLIGVGRIGTLVARKAISGFGMKVIGYDPYASQDQVLPGIEMTGDLAYILSNSDFVSLHCPITACTKKLISTRELVQMKRTAFLINASRGELVDEAGLVSALKSNLIAGAALDVFEDEPPSRDNPLFGLENVVLSPHNAALTREAAAKMSLHAAMGIDEVLSGRTPSWPVNKPRIG